MIRIPIPVFRDDSVYDKISITRPKVGVLADTRRIAEGGDSYSAMHAFLSGCTEAIEKTDGQVITEKASIKNILRSIPFRSAEYAAIQIILLVDPDDGVEGIYRCPLCGESVVSQFIEKDGEVEIDTRDFISRLQVTFMDEHERLIRHDFNSPVEIKDSRGEIIESVSSIEMDHPTISHCISAFRRYGISDEIRLQLGAYIEALNTVNGNVVDARWKNMLGPLFIDSIDDQGDLRALAGAVNKFGIDKRVRKNCTRCGKAFDVAINTSNFFASGLRP